MGRYGMRSGRTLFEREWELAAVDEALADVTGLRTSPFGRGTGVFGPGAAADEPPADLPGRPRGGLPGRPRGGLLAFAGGAGIGKTSLLAEVRRRAEAKGCTVRSPPPPSSPTPGPCTASCCWPGA